MSDAPAPVTPPAAKPNDNPLMQQFLERKEKFAALRVDLTLGQLGGVGHQDDNPDKWKIHGLGNFLIDGQKWWNVNMEKGGFGAMSLVEHALGLRPGQALKWLESNFGDADREDWKADASAMVGSGIRVKKEFQPPERFVDGIDDVRDYLVEERFLPASLINSEIERGTIYATRHIMPNGRMSGRPRCVFISSAAAEIRSVEPGGFKGCCPGSDTRKSGYRVTFAPGKNEQALALTEAAISGLSYRTLFPGRFVISTNGSGRFDLQYALSVEAIDNGYGVRAAFDADWAGDKAAQKLFNAIFVRKLLTKVLDVEPEVIDKWFLDKDIHIDVDNSPHHNFFNAGWSESLPVAERMTVAEMAEAAAAGDAAPGEEGVEEAEEDDHDHKQEKERWRLTDKVSPPVIRLMVTKQVHAKLPVKREGHEIKVTEAAFRFICDQMRVRRDRPVMGNDWNDDLRQLGSSYLRSYEKLEAQGFPEFPPLPPALDAMREPPPPRRAPAP